MTARQSISVMTEYSYALRLFTRSTRIPTDEREGRKKKKREGDRREGEREGTKTEEKKKDDVYSRWYSPVVLS